MLQKYDISIVKYCFYQNKILLLGDFVTETPKISVIFTTNAMQKFILLLIAIMLTPTLHAQPRCNNLNPMIWADYPDPDVIRVGEYYYMVTTTMHYMPGGPIMRSRDLIHWETVSYLFDSLHDSPAYDLQDGTHYGQGQWATSLRYHNGRFFALFVTNGVPGSWVYSTTDPQQGWHLHAHLRGFYHDPSLFFDDDDRVYVFSGSGSVDITELTADVTSEKEGGFRSHIQVRDSIDNGLLEGSRVIKHNGYYYILMISWPRTGRRQLAYRSRSLSGPWQKQVILDDNFDGLGGVGQGTIVDDTQGKWYGIIFQDRAAVGRILTLSPCRWIDDWPILGDSLGHVPPSPHVATVTRDLQWNHNPDSTSFRWVDSNTLELSPHSTAPNIFMARNTLTWRMWGPQCADTIVLDISKFHDGDNAGFSALNGDAGVLAVSQQGKRRFLTFSSQSVVLDNRKRVTGNNIQEIERIDITGKKRLWLSIHADFRNVRDMATFQYSTDGKSWHTIGTPYHMRFDYRRFFTGTRFALFYYSTLQPGGKISFIMRND